MAGFDVDCYRPGSSFSKAAIAAAFVEASDWVRDNAGSCDGFLALGLEFESMKEVFWLADEVRRRAAMAAWPDPADVPEEWKWAYWSARKFLETCLQYELGIWTS